MPLQSRGGCVRRMGLRRVRSLTVLAAAVALALIGVLLAGALWARDHNKRDVRDVCPTQSLRRLQPYGPHPQNPEGSSTRC
jgi:hypothetical protein